MPLRSGFQYHPFPTPSTGTDPSTPRSSNPYSPASTPIFVMPPLSSAPTTTRATFASTVSSTVPTCATFSHHAPTFSTAPPPDSAVAIQFDAVNQLTADLTSAIQTTDSDLISVLRQQLSAELTALSSLVEQAADASLFHRFRTLRLSSLPLDTQARLAILRITSSPQASITAPANQNSPVSSPQPGPSSAHIQSSGQIESIPVTSSLPEELRPTAALPDYISHKSTNTTTDFSPASAPTHQLTTAAPTTTHTPTFLHSLPKINLDTFNGNPLLWGDWHRKFSFLIGNQSLSPDQKMAYLQGLVTGRARDAIKHYNCNGALYQEALNTLNRKFGQPETIVHNYLQRLQDLSVTSLTHTSTLPHSLMGSLAPSVISTSSRTLAPLATSGPSQPSYHIASSSDGNSTSLKRRSPDQTYRPSMIGSRGKPKRTSSCTIISHTATQTGHPTYHPTHHIANNHHSST